MSHQKITKANASKQSRTTKTTCSKTSLTYIPENSMLGGQGKSFYDCSIENETFLSDNTPSSSIIQPIVNNTLISELQTTLGASNLALLFPCGCSDSRLSSKHFNSQKKTVKSSTAMTSTVINMSDSSSISMNESSKNNDGISTTKQRRNLFKPKKNDVKKKVSIDVTMSDSCATTDESLSNLTPDENRFPKKMATQSSKSNTFKHRKRGPKKKLSINMEWNGSCDADQSLTNSSTHENLFRRKMTRKYSMKCNFDETTINDSSSNASILQTNSIQPKTNPIEKPLIKDDNTILIDPKGLSTSDYENPFRKRIPRKYSINCNFDETTIDDSSLDVTVDKCILQTNSNQPKTNQMAKPSIKDNTMLIDPKGLSTSDYENPFRKRIPRKYSINCNFDETTIEDSSLDVTVDKCILQTNSNQPKTNQMEKPSIKDNTMLIDPKGLSTSDYENPFHRKLPRKYSINCNFDETIINDSLPDVTMDKSVLETNSIQLKAKQMETPLNGDNWIVSMLIEPNESRTSVNINHDNESCTNYETDVTLNVDSNSTEEISFGQKKHPIHTLSEAKEKSNILMEIESADDNINSPLHNDNETGKLLNVDPGCTKELTIGQKSKSILILSEANTKSNTFMESELADNNINEDKYCDSDNENRLSLNVDPSYTEEISFVRKTKTIHSLSEAKEKSNILMETESADNNINKEMTVNVDPCSAEEISFGQQTQSILTLSNAKVKTSTLMETESTDNNINGDQHRNNDTESEENIINEKHCDSDNENRLSLNVDPSHTEEISFGQKTKSILTLSNAKAKSNILIETESEENIINEKHCDSDNENRLSLNVESNSNEEISFVQKTQIIHTLSEAKEKSNILMETELADDNINSQLHNDNETGKLLNVDPVCTEELTIGQKSKSILILSEAKTKSNTFMESELADNNINADKYCDSDNENRLSLNVDPSYTEEISFVHKTKTIHSLSEAKEKSNILMETESADNNINKGMTVNVDPCSAEEISCGQKTKSILTLSNAKAKSNILIETESEDNIVNEKHCDSDNENRLSLNVDPSHTEEISFGQKTKSIHSLSEAKEKSNILMENESADNNINEDRQLPNDNETGKLFNVEPGCTEELTIGQKSKSILILSEAKTKSNTFTESELADNNINEDKYCDSDNENRLSLNVDPSYTEEISFVHKTKTINSLSEAKEKSNILMETELADNSSNEDQHCYDDSENRLSLNVDPSHTEEINFAQGTENSLILSGTKHILLECDSTTANNITENKHICNFNESGMSLNIDSNSHYIEEISLAQGTENNLTLSSIKAKSNTFMESDSTINDDQDKESGMSLSVDLSILRTDLKIDGILLNEENNKSIGPKRLSMSELDFMIDIERESTVNNNSDQNLYGDIESEMSLNVDSNFGNELNLGERASTILNLSDTKEKSNILMESIDNNMSVDSYSTEKISLGQKTQTIPTLSEAKEKLMETESADNNINKGMTVNVDPCSAEEISFGQQTQSILTLSNAKVKTSTLMETESTDNNINGDQHRNNDTESGMSLQVDSYFSNELNLGGNTSLTLSDTKEKSSILMVTESEENIINEKHCDSDNENRLSLNVESNSNEEISFVQKTQIIHTLSEAKEKSNILMETELADDNINSQLHNDNETGKLLNVDPGCTEELTIGQKSKSILILSEAKTKSNTLMETELADNNINEKHCDNDNENRLSLNVDPSHTEEISFGQKTKSIHSLSEAKEKSNLLMETESADNNINDDRQLPNDDETGKLFNVDTGCTEELTIGQKSKSILILSEAKTKSNTLMETELADNNINEKHCDNDNENRLSLNVDPSHTEEISFGHKTKSILTRSNAKAKSKILMETELADDNISEDQYGNNDNENRISLNVNSKCNKEIGLGPKTQTIHSLSGTKEKSNILMEIETPDNNITVNQHFHNYTGISSDKQTMNVGISASLDGQQNSKKRRKHLNTPINKRYKKEEYEEQTAVQITTELNNRSESNSKKQFPFSVPKPPSNVKNQEISGTKLRKNVTLNSSKNKISNTKVRKSVTFRSSKNKIINDSTENDVNESSRQNKSGNCSDSIKGLVEKRKRKSNVFKEKPIYDLSYDTSLDLSFIPKGQTLPKKGLIFHSTPIHRVPKKSLTKYEQPMLTRNRIDDCSSNISDADVCSNKRIGADASSNNRIDLDVCSNNRIDADDCSNNRIDTDDCSSNISDADVCSNNRIDADDCSSNRSDADVCSSNRIDADVCSNNRIHYACSSSRDADVCSSNISEEIDFSDSESLKTVESLPNKRLEKLESIFVKRKLRSKQDSVFFNENVESVKKNKENKLSKMPKRFKSSRRWINNDLYKYLDHELSRTFKTEARKYAEEIVILLDHTYTLVIQGHEESALPIFKKKLKDFKICETVLDFCTFVFKYTPLDFQKKVLPLGGAFGCVQKENVSPFDPLC